MFMSFFIFYLSLINTLESKKALANASKEIINDLNYFTQSKVYFQLRNLDSINSNKKNLIIGLIRGYTWSIIKPFFISLISTEINNYDLVIFVDKLSDETLEKIKLCGAIIKDISEKNLGYQDLIKYRWKLFSDFLKENKDKYNLVFATDIKDVIFQKDIFHFYNNTISFISFNLRNSVNKNWVKSFCKTNEEYFKIADEQVISDGTIISTVDKFLEFTDTLWQTISNLSNINDQGAINYLIHYNDSIRITDNYGPIITISTSGNNKISVDSDNNVLNLKGKIAGIVHQYDRKPEIVKKINKKYSDDILNKYFNNKTKEVKKVNDEYKAKVENKKRIKFIRKIILFGFIIISIICITCVKAIKSGIFGNSTNEDNYRKKAKKTKRKYKSKNIYKYNISSSENIIY